MYIFSCSFVFIGVPIDALFRSRLADCEWFSYSTEDLLGKSPSSVMGAQQKVEKKKKYIYREEIYSDVVLKGFRNFLTLSFTLQ